MVFGTSFKVNFVMVKTNILESVNFKQETIHDLIMCIILKPKSVLNILSLHDCFNL